MVVAFCWRSIGWMIFGLGAGLVLQLWFWRARADAVAMLAAAILGPPIEALCVKTGIWTYDSPGLVFGVPVWLPLVWAYLFGYYRRIALVIHEISLKIWPNSRDRWRIITFGLLGAVILIYFLVTVFLIRRNIALCYTAAMIPIIIFWRKERDIIIFGAGGIIGTVGEYIYMQLGFWEYHFPVFKSIGLPLSLPLAWGISSIYVSRIAGLWEKKDKEASSAPSDNTLDRESDAREHVRTS